MSDAVASAAGGRLSAASRKQGAEGYGSRPSASWAADVGVTSFGSISARPSNSNKQYLTCFPGQTAHNLESFWGNAEAPVKLIAPRETAKHRLERL